jgi:hypothetical protein
LLGVAYEMTMLVQAVGEVLTLERAKAPAT